MPFVDSIEPVQRKISAIAIRFNKLEPLHRAEVATEIKLYKQDGVAEWVVD